jgi:hypothetical protein
VPPTPNTPVTPATPDAARLHAAFLSILPRIELLGHVYFRGLKCQQQKEDFIADMVGLAWKWFVRLVEKGKDPMDFPSALATYASKAVKAGRRLTGQERSKDVMSPVAKRKHGVKVERLPSSTPTTLRISTATCMASGTSTPSRKGCATTR